MRIFDFIKNAYRPVKYPMKEFGIHEMEFFVALLRACPEGSRLSFDHSEPEAFVSIFREWSHRERPENFEADYYSIDARFIGAIEQVAARGELELDHHFGIRAHDGRPLCSSVDDFLEMTLADDIQKAIRTNHLRSRRLHSD